MCYLGLNVPKCRFFGEIETKELVDGFERLRGFRELLLLRSVDVSISGYNVVFHDYGSVRCSNDVVFVARGGDQFRKRLASEDEDDASESFYQPRRTFPTFF